MTPKKLTLDDAKKTVLADALQETAGTMDRYMRRIYDETRGQVLGSGDRILLTEAQAGTVKHALEHHVAVHGEDDAVKSMLLQLTLTRKELRAMATA